MSKIAQAKVYLVNILKGYEWFLGCGIALSTDPGRTTNILKILVAYKNDEVDSVVPKSVSNFEVKVIVSPNASAQK